MTQLDERAATDRISLASSIIAALPRPGSRSVFFDRLLDAVFSTLDAQRAFIVLRRDPDGEVKRVASRNEEPSHEGTEIEASQTILRRTLDSGVGQLLVDAGRDDSVGKAQSVRDLRLRSVVCAPILMRDEVVGLIHADNRVHEVVFSEEDLEFLGLLGRLAGVALENLDLQGELACENEGLRAALREGLSLLTASPVMEPVVRMLRRAARTDVSVLLLGESGAGKEVAARSLHDLSDRSDGPFVGVNCAALPESLLEAELFGLAPKSGVAGAPPEGRPGRFEQAHGGTLLLDEIGDMAHSTQARILRALETRTVDRIGGTKPVPVDLRVIAATNHDLEAEVAAGRFREDLLFRLRVVELTIPPLRERPDDVTLLAETFVDRLSGGRVRLDRTAREALLAHDWPGNVRELRNAVERALVLCEGRRLRAEHLPRQVRGAVEASAPEACLLPTLDEVERQHVERVLRATDGEIAAAARVLGVARNTLYAKMRKWDLRKPGATA